MLFNSLEFFVFLPSVLFLYWALNQSHSSKGLKLQNLLLVASSYVFYGWWDFRFLTLIVFSTVVDFVVGKQIERCHQRALPGQIQSKPARRWLAVSIVVNLGLLGFFKYANFFIDSWVSAWESLGVSMNSWTLNVILPVGISFYTFQTLSYSIDIYRRKLTPTSDIVEFAAFVSFFPQLVAGPIERAKSLLPQIQTSRTFSWKDTKSGVQLMIWGLYKKVVIADTCAIYVDDVFSNHLSQSWEALAIGAILFAFQIYGDFSGYSDMAIGIARLFGIKLMTNFKTPYLSRDVAEFWRKWHISLSTWFRDYLYFPLGGSRHGLSRTVRNTIVVFLISGLWHGANLTFLVWGFFHSMLFLPLLLMRKNRKHLDQPFNIARLDEIFGVMMTFFTVSLAWVFFRATDVESGFEYVGRLFSLADGVANVVPSTLLAFLVANCALEETITRGQRWATVNLALILLIVWRSHFNLHNDFIYFQF